MANEDSSLLAIERQKLILSILEREGVVRSTELKELLNVSIVTIRSDLKELANIGECELIWGGAVYRRATPERELLVNQRSQLNPDLKQRIGQRAATMIEVGQTIIVDAGTTTVEMIHSLPRDMEYLRIVTPALNIASAALYYPNVELVMTGGVLRNLTHSLIGIQVIRALEMINADLAFLATGAFSIEHGVTTGNILEVEVKRTMVQRARKVVLLADSTKFGKMLSLTVAPLEALDVIITDKGLVDQDVAAIEALGVEVVRV